MTHLLKDITDYELNGLSVAIEAELKTRLNRPEGYSPGIKKKKTVYIAGKVTGEPPHQCNLKFAMAVKEMEALGYEAINPMQIVNDIECDWNHAMRVCIQALMAVDKVYFLKDWQESKGAILEHQIAENFGLKIMYEVEPSTTDHPVIIG